MSGTYANPDALPVAITLDDVRTGCRAMAAPPRVVSDITVAMDVYEALIAGLRAGGVDDISAAHVYVDKRLPPGAWHRGQPMP